VLDEPTNDLDLETLDLLQEMLADYAGTVLLVSHDRDFLDRVAGSVLVSEGDGQWIEYAGGYSDMLVQRRGEAPAERHSEDRGENDLVSKNTVKSEKKQTKLSYNDKRTLDLLPGKMTKLEKAIVTYREALSDPVLYSKDPAKFTKISDALQAAERELTDAEEQWLELEAKKEELESQ